MTLSLPFGCTLSLETSLGVHRRDAAGLSHTQVFIVLNPSLTFLRSVKWGPPAWGL